MTAEEGFTYTLYRFNSGADSTQGLIMAPSGIDGALEFKCFTLEDERREEKVPGETRIPCGTYEIKLRAEGGLYNRKAHYWGCERGMLWLQDVPGFEWIYLHPGNTDDDSEGCILPGFSCNANVPGIGEGSVGYSIVAFRALYGEMIKLMDGGKRVFLKVEDIA